MTRGVLAGLFLTLCACGKERPDPRIAELTSPLHITVRAIEVPVEKDCQGTLLERAQCLFSRADRQGCTYVELGEAADKPVTSKSPDLRRCAMSKEPQRVVLVNQPSRKATITLESSGRRAIIELADAAYAIYLRNDELVVHRKLWEVATPAGATSRIALPPGTVDWSRVPPFLSVVDHQLLLKMPEAELDALLAESPTGKAELKSALLALAPSADLAGDAWTVAVSKLDESDRKDLRDEIVTALANGNIDALDWFDAHPEEQKADYVDALASAAEDEAVELSDVLPRLLKFEPARAERIACDHLQRRWHDYGADAYEYDYNPPSATALAVLITRKAKCDWVVPTLLRSPCSDELRCDPDPHDGKPTPLCTSAQIEKALHRAMTPELELSDEEYELIEYDWGALLVAAARLQGPLPADFVRADERRLYKQRYTYEEDELDDPCRRLSLEAADWACRLPTSVTTAHYEDCTIVLDDAKKTMTLSAAPPDEED